MEPVRGYIYLNGDMLPFEMELKDGVIKRLETGDAGRRTDGNYVALPPLVNAHTHIGDAFIEEEVSADIMELVAPPNGLKHRRLRDADDREILKGMQGALEEMYASGVRGFADFREQGVRGVRLLKEALASFNDLLSVPGLEPMKAIILGRPDGDDDLDELLEEADGLGISSITDHDMDYLRELRREADKRGKLFALHVSERVREDMDRVLELRPDFIIHMNEATDEDMQRVADAHIPVVVCPSSNMFFGKIPPVRRMLDAGIKVALGTDNLMLSSPSILREMSVLTLATGLAGEPLTQREALAIGVDATREVIGLPHWEPAEGERWDGQLIPMRYGGPWRAVFR